MADTDVASSHEGFDEDDARDGVGSGAAVAVRTEDAPEDGPADEVELDAEDTDDESDEESDEESDDSYEESDGDGPSSGRGRRRGTPSIERLEEEGEVAADYLEELLDITDLDGDIDIDVENGRASVAVVAEGGADRQLRRLVGGRGEVLEALQELTRLAVQARTGERSRLMLDIGGFRAARRRALEDVAARAVQDVQRSGGPVRLEPMSAFERKVVHDVVAESGLRSESEGEEPSRRVVVHPATA